MNVEICCSCDEQTGRAGKGDDSIYLEDGTGPYCTTCEKINLDARAFARFGKVYRKTATIRAKQWLKMGDHEAVEDYCGKHPDRRGDDFDSLAGACTALMRDHGWIDTLEGGHIVCPGDYIATGVEGEHWPIKPSIFEKTYEEETSKP